VWTADEVESVLGRADGHAFCAAYDISPAGNFEGHSIPNLRKKESLAAARNSAFDEPRRKLFEHREHRIKPGRDEKVLTAWNGLMLAAFADAAGVLGSDEYLVVAKRNAAFILSELHHDGRLLRTWKQGSAKLNGYVEDYANVVDGLVVLYQASGEVRYLNEARRLADTMITEFWDEEVGGFFFTSHDHEELVVRNKDFYDNATPSGNSAAADVLLRLSKLTGDDKYEKFAAATLRLIASQLRRYPQGFGRALSAMEFYLADTKEIAIVGSAGNDLVREVLSTYLPNTVVAHSAAPASDASSVPLFSEREAVDGRPTAYVCENFVCQRPVNTVSELRTLIADG
jgi:uncharacterized protein YyaL (SSP411 family)